MSIENTGVAELLETRWDKDTRNYYCKIKCCCGAIYEKRRASWVSNGIVECPGCKGKTNHSDLKVFVVNRAVVSREYARGPRKGKTKTTKLRLNHEYD